ncbi:hypothetical protein [Actinokineospora enzanensis]|uniref:hypothetical protein n=1 Tax=Actinokineospora enzanensis TaxID=155975 RepID=UPI0003783E71|nr:hypothetical protein [Actinokineospora enzanensis]
MSRAELAAAQAELLRAVLAGGPVPAGFDVDAVRVEASSLLAKRRRIVAQLGPEVAAELGDRFGPLFDEYADGNPRAAGSRFRADAESFARWLRERGELAPEPRRRWWRR